MTKKDLNKDFDHEEIPSGTKELENTSVEFDLKENPSALVFPCEFPIKIMGDFRIDFTDIITQAVRELAPDFDPTTAEVRFSSEKKYISITCTINAQSKDQLDQLYRKLTNHPIVKVVL
jgi:putative lipoic acid-binding regulatory protein